MGAPSPWWPQERSSSSAQRIRPRWLYACGWLPSPRSVCGSYCSGSRPGRAGAVEHLVEQLLGVGPAAGAQVRLDQPGGAEVEAALDAGQAVVPAVPVDRRAARAVRPRPPAPWPGSAGRRRPADRTARSTATTRPSRRSRRRRCTRRRSSSQPLSSTFSAMVVAQRAASSGTGPAVPLEELERPVDGHPAHDLGVHVVPGRQARLPDAVVGLVPAPLDRLDHRLHQREVAGVRPRGLGERGDQVGDRAEHVELDLAGWRRCRPAPGGSRRSPGSVSMTASGPSSVPSTRVQRVQPLRVPAGVCRRTVSVQPQQRLGLLGGAEVDQGLGGHRGVAQPAVPVVPVADPPISSGSEDGRGGQDRAGRLVPQPAQRERAAHDQVAGDRRQPQRVGPVPPARPRRLAWRSSDARPRAGRVGRCPGAAPARRVPPDALQVDHGPGQVAVPPSSSDVPVDAGGVERDRLVGAEHQQARRRAAAAGSAPGRTRAAARTRPGPGELPDSTARCATSPLGVGGRRSSQSVTVSPDQRVSTVIVPGRYRWPSGRPPRSGRDREVAGRRRRRAGRRRPRRRVRLRVAQPGDPGGRGQQGDGVRPLDSIECRSIGTACSPNSQRRRVCSSSSSTPHRHLGVGDAEAGRLRCSPRRRP